MGFLRSYSLFSTLLLGVPLVGGLLGPIGLPLSHSPHASHPAHTYGPEPRNDLLC